MMLNNLREIADHYQITKGDYELACDIVGSGYRTADLVIAPDGKPYLYRWHVIPQSDWGNVYFHIQVADDPERPLHDHPWDNTSVILSGGYFELLSRDGGEPQPYYRYVGDKIDRKADWGHQLLMSGNVPYTMTLFTTGPKRRTWGFWYPSGWVSHHDVCRTNGNVSVHVKKEGE
jgi:hypothetical protein